MKGKSVYLDRYEYENFFTHHVKIYLSVLKMNTNIYDLTDNLICQVFWA